jgi:hypothetical protein
LQGKIITCADSVLGFPLGGGNENVLQLLAVLLGILLSGCAVAQEAVNTVSGKPRLRIPGARNA